MREKGKLPCLDFFSTCEISEEKKIYTFTMRRFFRFMFSIILEDNYLTCDKKKFLRVFIFYEEIIFIENTIFWEH